MPSQKISQLTAITTVASGDYFPIVRASGTTNQRVEVGVLDARYYSAASGALTYTLADAAGQLATTALASGNAGISSSLTKLPFSGGVVSGRFAQNVVPLGLYGSGVNCNLGNFFTATLSGNTQVVFTNAPTSVAYGFTYEVNHQIGTITWPDQVVWPSATAPTLTTGKTHLFMFVTDDSGTTWRGSSLINYNS